MQKYDFWAVTKDQGGTNTVLPVVRWLRERAFSVLLVVNGLAKNLVPVVDKCVTCDTAEEALEKYPLPSVFLTSMCSGGGVGRDLVPELTGRGIPTVALQDHWGSRLWTDWSQPAVRPDYIVVNDSLGTKLVREAWIGFPHERVLELGYPALDQFAKFDSEKAASSARKKLKLPTGVPVILFSGQLAGTGKTLLALVQTLNPMGREVCVIARPHGRAKTDAPAIERELWAEAVQRFRCGQLIEDLSSSLAPSDPEYVPIRDALAASDLIVSMFSSTLTEAACLRKPAISVLLPGEGGGMEAFLAESQSQRPFVPAVELDCCEQARTEVELRWLLDKFFLSGLLELRERQEKVFRLDGKNTERVGHFVGRLALGRR